MKKLLVLFLMIFYIQCLFALEPDTTYAYRPENFGIIYKEIKALTSDNLKINIWFFPAQDSVPWNYNEHSTKRPYKTIDNKKHPTIIVCPQDAGNMAPMFQYAYYICPRGYNVVTFDWRGFGESDKWPIIEDYLCYKEFFLDIEAVVNKIKTLNEVDTSRIGICGYSMPAFQAFPVFSKRSDLKCFIGGALSANLDSINTPVKIKQ